MREVDETVTKIGKWFSVQRLWILPSSAQIRRASLRVSKRQQRIVEYRQEDALRCELPCSPLGSPNRERVKLAFQEREAMWNGLSLRGSLAYVAFCAERCRGEARRYAPVELDRVPALDRAIALIWRAALQDDVQYDDTVAGLDAELDSFILPSDPEGRLTAKYDIAVSLGMWVAHEGLGCAA